MNLSADMSIIEIDNLIKSLPKERLQKELESPTGHFPLYLVAGRLKEMESMEADAQAAAAEKKTSEQAPSVAHRLAMTQPPVMSEVAAAPQPQPQPDPAGQAAQMLMPTVNAAGGYSLPTVYAETGKQGADTSELVNQYLAELKLRKDRAEEKRSKTDEFAVDNSGDFAKNMGKQPFGKGGIADLGSLADIRAAQVKREERSDPTPISSDEKTKGRFTGGVSGVHSRIANESEDTEFDKMLAQLIKESNKSRSAKKANQGGYVRSLPTTYAQEGLYFEDDPRSQEIQSLDSEIQKIRSDREQMIDMYKGGGRVSDEEAAKYGASAYNPRLSPLLQERSDLVESAYSPESSQISETAPKVSPPKNLSGNDVIKSLNAATIQNLAPPDGAASAVPVVQTSETSAAEEGGPNEAQLKRLGVSSEVFNKFSEGGKSRLMSALNAKTQFKKDLAPSVIENTLRREARLARVSGIPSPFKRLSTYFFEENPQKNIALAKKSKDALELGKTIIAAADKELGNTNTTTVDRKDDDPKGGPNFIPKANAAITTSSPNEFPSSGFGDLEGYTFPKKEPVVTAKKAVPITAEEMTANKSFLKQSVKDNVGGTDGSENKVKKLTDDGYKTLADQFKKSWKKAGVLGEPIDLAAWQKETKAGNERAYSIYKDLGKKSENATQDYIKSLEKDRKAIKTFAETGKLPEGRRSQLLNNILITFGASLLGNPTMAGALSKGLMASLKLQKGAEDEYADALNNNLKATKQIGDLKMKALEIANANKRDLLGAIRADKQADNLARQQLEGNIMKRQNLALNIEKTILSQVMAQQNYEVALINATKDSKEERGLKTERSRGINSLIADYKSQLDEAGNDRAKIQAVNEKFKDVFPKKKGLLYLDVSNPLDKGVNKYLDKIGAPWYAKIRRTGVDPVVTQSRLLTEDLKRKNIGAQARGRVFKTVRGITSGDREYRKDTSKYWNQFITSPAGARFKGVKKYKPNDATQSRAFQSWLLTRPEITEGSPAAASSRTKQVYDPVKKSVTKE